MGAPRQGWHRLLHIHPATLRPLILREREGGQQIGVGLRRADFLPEPGGRARTRSLLQRRLHRQPILVHAGSPGLVLECEHGLPFAVQQEVPEGRHVHGAVVLPVVMLGRWSWLPRGQLLGRGVPQRAGVRRRCLPDRDLCRRRGEVCPARDEGLPQEDRVALLAELGCVDAHGLPAQHRVRLRRQGHVALCVVEAREQVFRCLGRWPPHHG
mmetsp:Transcript_9186/g.26402  ORF Transcript_9186/g.26402 Transcript_9186/m.26402 type:complete len:212 (+) Transcript_9186:490-1125(+)